MKLFVNNIKDSVPPSGVVLSFDDTETQSWINFHNDYGKPKGWKASFYVFDQTNVDDMQFLESEGHEIGNHTINHFNGVREYIAGGGTPRGYYETWLEPLDDWLISNSILKPTTFRYPFGFTEDSVSSHLINTKLYNFVTPTIGNATDSLFKRPYDAIWKYDRYAESLKMDTNIPDYDEDFYISLLEYARDNNKILSLFGHGIRQGGGGVNWTSTELLRRVVDFVYDNGMTFYRTKDLENYVKQQTFNRGNV